MRLICPNCGAQYEVDASIIPPNGRDVQCSNCGTNWFHEGAPRVARDKQSGGAQLTNPESAKRARPVRRPASAVSKEDLTMLREEAQHEAELRAQDAEQIETQTDLGLSDSDVEQRAISARRAVVRKGAAKTSRPARPGQPPKPTSRRDLLPDIEEINSTLTPDEHVSDEDEEGLPLEQAPKRSSRNVRLGFISTLALGGIAAGAYAVAPSIETYVPGAAGIADGYLSFVDTMRVSVTDRFDGFVEQLGHAASSAVDRNLN